MKRTALLSLCAITALLVACGGSQESAGQPAGESGNVANMTFGSVADAQDYLTANYTEDQMKKMYIEFTALSVADMDYYYKKDESGAYIEQDEETQNKIHEKMNENIDAVIKQFGINHQLYAALMMHVRDTDWPMTLDDQVSARAKEILAARGDN